MTKKKTEQAIMFENNDQPQNVYDELQQLLRERDYKKREHDRYIAFYNRLSKDKAQVNSNEEYPVRISKITIEDGETLDKELVIGEDEVQLDKKLILKAIFESVAKYEKIIMDIELKIADLAKALTK